MKASSATSAKATAPSRPTGRSSGRQHTPTSADFALSGPSNPPDPAFHAFRDDLADIALAGQVIASHYAEPLLRRVAAAGPLRAAADSEGEIIGSLCEGDRFEMLDNSLGWAWGYAGDERRVGYIRSEMLGG